MCESISVDWSGAAGSLVSPHPPSITPLPCVTPPLCHSLPSLTRTDAAGRSGLHYVVRVIVHLLDPSSPEFSAAFVGKLIVVFVQKASFTISYSIACTCHRKVVQWLQFIFIPPSLQAGAGLSEYLELVLRSVLSKMQVVQTDSVMQSLLLVFAHLIQTEVHYHPNMCWLAHRAVLPFHQQLEAVVAFLSQVPDPQGQPALHFVMSEWAAKHVSSDPTPSTYGSWCMRFPSLLQPFFFGVYEMRVSTLALCKLLSHYIASGDERLSNIMVRGEEVHSAGEGTANITSEHGYYHP